MNFARIWDDPPVILPHESADASTNESEDTMTDAANQPNQPIRIGEILVEQGVLNEQQVLEILQAQRQRGVPFGVLAEEMFDVTVESIEKAWIEQYHRFTGLMDLSTQRIDTQALSLINRRQAWQFEILPLRFEPNGELLVAASRHRLARAVTFAASRLQPVAFFRVVESSQLREFLRKHYPMPEVSDAILRRARDMAHEIEADDRRPDLVA